VARYNWTSAAIGQGNRVVADQTLITVNKGRSMQADSREPIDRVFLARFTRGSAPLEREILQLFAQQMPLYIGQLRGATTAQDWKLAAHSIKGSALAVGAHALAEAAQTAERLDFEADAEEAWALRSQSVAAVAVASDKTCNYIACLFATA
jgi:HPt (histidine-containing phosphotransfer) domain-containing protein